MTKLKKHLRSLSFAILICMTAYGLHGFLSDDAARVVDAWRHKGWSLAAALGLSGLDLLSDMALWMLVCEFCGVRVRDAEGATVFLSAQAGLLLPAQLGRLLRPDALVRLGRGTLGAAVEAEAVTFLLTAIGGIALLVGLLGFSLHPLGGVAAFVGTVVLVLFFANRLAGFLAGRRLQISAEFWWRWRTGALVCLAMAGWILHGVSFYLVTRDLPGDSSLPGCMFFAPASALLGSSTGLPGGLGAIEGSLGVSLRMMKIPEAHLMFAVGGFRLVTFWIWLPLGWLALGLVNRRIRSRRQADLAEEPGPSQASNHFS